MGLLSRLLPLLAAVAATHASVLTIQSPRVTVASTNGTQLRSEQLSLSQPLSSPLTLGPTDTLKLTFQIADKDGGKGIQPHQTFLRFHDESSGEEGIQPVRVGAGGKAKFELNMARPPTSLPPTTSGAPVKVTLLLGSFVHPPAKFSLFELHVPASYPPPQHPEEPSFHPLPPIAHTFRPEQKTPPKFVSAAFTLLVLSPWAVLLGLWSQSQYRVPHLFSLSVLPFSVLLGTFEGLLLWYWIGLKLGQVLLYGAILGVFTALAGRQALATTGDRRLGKK